MIADTGWDFANRLLVTITSLVVVVLPLVWVDLRSRRRAHQSLEELHAKADKTYQHLNSVEEAVAGEETLGQIVVRGFRDNRQQHEDIKRSVRHNSELLHQYGERLDVQQDQLDDLRHEKK